MSVIIPAACLGSVLACTPAARSRSILALAGFIGALAAAALARPNAPA